MTEDSNPISQTTIQTKFDIEEQQSPTNRQQLQITKTEMSKNYEHLIEDQPLPKQFIIPKRIKRYIVCLMVLVVFLYRMMRNEVSQGQCIYDRLHVWTQYFNDKINSDTNFAYTVETIGQVLIDIEFLFLLTIIITRVRTFEVHSWMVVFYGVRAFFLETLKFPFTEGHFWDQPPLPSLMVPYGKSRDYFYSGHTGYMVFGILYFSKVGSKPLTIFNIVGLFVVMFVVLVTRVHYTIDIFTGYVISHQTYWFVNKYLPLFDRFWSLPYHATLKLYNKLTTR